MIVQQLSLNNFRIHGSSRLEFDPRLNFIVGGNGQGKTSVIEAIYFLCTTKNYKASPDLELLKFGESSYEINAVFSDISDNSVRIRFSPDENKRIYLKDGKPVHRSADVIGNFPVVLLTPEDHALTQGSPAERRKLMDSVISQGSAVYLNVILEYAKILKQRAALLNRIHEFREKNLNSELAAFTLKLVELGTEIIEYRKKFVDQFSALVKDVYTQIMDGQEPPEIVYRYLKSSPEENIRDEFLKAVNARKDEEIRRGLNLTGPHRDDLEFTVSGRSLKAYGSQGQHKTFQVALRFAQFFYLKQISGKTPVFLLDDVFGELDAKRAARISRYLMEVGQAIITMTDLSNYNYLREMNTHKVFTIANGSVSDESNAE